MRATGNHQVVPLLVIPVSSQWAPSASVPPCLSAAAASANRSWQSATAPSRVPAETGQPTTAARTALVRASGSTWSWVR